MGSQTLEILRQGVWASLTGGWFYDPHQGVFCNIVHLYLWLYLLCSPFVTYLYFPGTWLTWSIYCTLTTLTILSVKIVNMALHRLYDRAQTMSEGNLKNQYLKVPKDSTCDNENGIELKEMGNDGSRNSVENTVNEASEESSIMSMENTNGIIDLKVDVHRKNSSESIELMFYAPSVVSGNSQRDDQQSLAGSASVSKSIRSNNTVGTGVITSAAATEVYTKYLESVLSNPVNSGSNSSACASVTNQGANGNLDTPRIKRQPRLIRKSSEDFRRRAQRRRLERQNSLDATAESAINSKLQKNSSETLKNSNSNSNLHESINTNSNGGGQQIVKRNETFLHSKSNTNATTTSSITVSSSTSITNTTATCITSSHPEQRLVTTISEASSTEGLSNQLCLNEPSSSSVTTKTNRLQRHKSSETHEERIKQKIRGIFLPVRSSEQSFIHHHHQRHHSHNNPVVSSSGALATTENNMIDTHDIDMTLGGSTIRVCVDEGGVPVKTVQSWILGSSSDVYFEDDGYTKSDFGIEQLDSRGITSAGRASLLSQQQNHLNSHYHHQPLHQESSKHSSHYRKDSNSTKSALHLPQLNEPQSSGSKNQNNNIKLNISSSSCSKDKEPSLSTQSKGANKIRRHSNSTASSYFRSTTLVNPYTATNQLSVRRIKSTALEVPCAQPSISNLSPHPNSVEAISGQQQIKNPPSAVLPPPSKTLVRNAHFDLRSKLGESSSTGSSLNFDGNSTCGSTTALIDPLAPSSSQLNDQLQHQQFQQHQLQQIQKRHKEKEQDRIPNEEQESKQNGTSCLQEVEREIISPHIGKESETLVLEDISIENEDLLLRTAASITCPILPFSDSHCDTTLYTGNRNSSVNDDKHKDDYKNDEDMEDVVIERNVEDANNENKSGKDDDEDKNGNNNNADSNNNNNKDKVVIDVPIRRLNNTETLECRRSVESDVGDILADNDTDAEDDFKDFDNNLQLMNDLNQTQNQLHDYLKQINIAIQKVDDLEAEDKNIKANVNAIANSSKSDVVENEEENEGAVGGCSFEKPLNTDIENELINRRERLHSTDSETENNTGSRSPLLNSKKYELKMSDSKKEAVPVKNDKVLHEEILDVQRKNHNTGKIKPFPKSAKGIEVDSGCPSSDCEQMSASSKDLLLGSNSERKTSNKVSEDSGKKGNENEDKNDFQEASTSRATIAKLQGAIPKTTKYHEMDEVKKNRKTENVIAKPNNSHLHRKRGGSSRQNSKVGESVSIEQPLSGGLGIARDGSSSTNSSRSNSLESNICIDQKALWAIQNDSFKLYPGKTNASRNPLYEESLQTLNLEPVSAENADFGEQSLGEMSLPANSIIPNGILISTRGVSEDLPLNFSSNLTGNPVNNSSNNTSSLRSRNSAPHRNVFSFNAPSHTVLSLHDTFLKNEMKQASTTTLDTSHGASRGHPPLQPILSNPISTGSGQIITLDDFQHCDNYCDYWRPANQLNAAKKPPPKNVYKYRYKLFGFENEFKISMDRLELLALFDKDPHWFHIVSAVFLSGLVAYLGATILQHNYYKDLYSFLFCAVIAGAQYSLVKSVQPDAASPIHGFNKTVAYSRAIYFCACSGLLLWFKQILAEYKAQQEQPFIFFGVRYDPIEIMDILLKLMYIILLCFPLIFSLGLFPQINTFLMYLLEQIDMNIFGGNAAGSLTGAFLCVLRSLVGVSLLYGPLYATLADKKGTQYISFSIFCAMLIPMGYHLSRSASDFSHLWALIKHCIVSTYRDDDDDLSAINSVRETTENIKNSKPSTTSTPKSHTKENIKEISIKTVNNENIELKPLSATIEKRTLKRTTDLQGTKAEHDTEQENTIFENKSFKSKGSSLASSSQTLAKTISSSKKLMTASSSFDSVTDEGDLPLPVSLNATDDRISFGVKESNGSHREDSHKRHEAPSHSQNAKDNSENIYLEEQEKLSTSSTTQACDMSTLTVAEAAEENGETGPTACSNQSGSSEPETPDPLPKKLQNTVNTRLKNDFVVSIFLALVVLGLHCSTVFTVLQPDLNIFLCTISSSLGLILHYFIPQVRKHMPWLCFAKPLFRQNEFGQFEVSNAPKIMWFEKFYIYLSMVEKNILFPLIIISAATANASHIAAKFGSSWGSLIVAICSLKFIRNSYSDPTNQYLIVLFTVLLFRVDFKLASEHFLIDYLFVSIFYRKCCDFLLKLQFIVTYIAPWQITWGSAFHAFAQPFSVPHSAMLFLQAAVSATLSTPLNPFLGSAIFLTSYVRPIKFWERDYNTRRIDHSNTRLSSQLERDLGADDNNLNSIFYEHLTRSLQHSLCGDLLMGRWGNVNQGDCFVLASDYLNCLVHIIELGNGLCTFQMRGLEFRGTYCQQREVEAITEDVEDNDGCCCCDPGHLPRMLSANAMFSTRWLAWQVVASQYVLEGYSITDNLASATLQVFDYRKVLITYYIKSIIYYVIKSPKLEQWLASEPIREALKQTLSRDFVELDPIFNYNLDEDFDFRAVGITRSSFCLIYLSWINYCYDKRLDATRSKDEENSNINATNATNTANDVSQHQHPQHQQTQQAQQAQSHILTAISPAVVTSSFNPYQKVTSSPNQKNIQTAVSNLTMNANSNSNTVNAGNVPLAPPREVGDTSSSNVYNDSRSSPNLTSHHQTAGTTATQNKSQSQQHLRSKSQKHSAMSDSPYVKNHLSNEQISSSQSFANISRQTSGSAPGLSGFHNPYSSDTLSLNQCTLNMSNASAGIRTSNSSSSNRPQTAPLRILKREESSSSNSPKGRILATPALSMNYPQQGLLQQQQQDKSGTLNGPEKMVIKLKVPSVAKDSPIVSLCLALSLLARRSLATASHNSLTGVEYFLHGLHALFKGDFRIQSPRDEWVFADMELLQSVVAPAVKMALKLQQDHITNPDEYLNKEDLFEAIDNISKDLVISHEADPIWRSAVLKGAPNLLALRHVMEDGSDEYRIIRLTKRFLTFRVIKLNRECVRGLWAGQQQELIYLRNINPERGSIQNAKQALRNIINSSCDQPIGYPIYVSPLTTSYSDTNEQLCNVAGGPITPESIKANVLSWWHRVRERCRQGCSSGSAMENSQMGLVGGSLVGGLSGCGTFGPTVGSTSIVPTCNTSGENPDPSSVYISAPIYNTLTVGNLFGLRSGPVPNNSLAATFGSDNLAVMRSGMTMMPLKPTSSTLIAGLLNREREQELAAVSTLVTSGGKDVRNNSNSALRRLQATSGPNTSRLSSERERRATLPIASTSLVTSVNPTGLNPSGTSSSNARSSSSKDTINPAEYSQLDKFDQMLLSYANAPRYSKISTSSGSLGIGNIITNPGEYPRKTKGPICLTSTTTNNQQANTSTESPPGAGCSSGLKTISSLAAEALRKPKIELFTKVIIIDENEIYDCFDMGKRVDFLWPNEEMRSNGGRFSWKDWEPKAGMVGHVVHCWIPNHNDLRMRSPINRIVYLVEIGQHYVPVGEYGLREYNQVLATSQAFSFARRSSIQRDYDEFRLQQQIRTDMQRSEGLTPILGSSLESPKSQLSLASVNIAPLGMPASYAGTTFDVESLERGNKRERPSKPKIQAVSSSSSEDEIVLHNIEVQRNFLLNMWEMMASDKQEDPHDDTNIDIEFEGCDYLPKSFKEEELQEEKDKLRCQSLSEKSLSLDHSEDLPEDEEKFDSANEETDKKSSSEADALQQMEREIEDNLKESLAKDSERFLRSPEHQLTDEKDDPISSPLVSLCEILSDSFKNDDSVLQMEANTSYKSSESSPKENESLDEI